MPEAMPEATLSSPYTLQRARAVSGHMKNSPVINHASCLEEGLLGFILRDDISVHTRITQERCYTGCLPAC